MRHSFLAIVLLAMLSSLGCKSAPPANTQPATTSAANESYPTLMTKSKELADALGRKDYAKVIDLTYPKVIELGGGRDKLLDTMTKELKSMEAEGVSIISSTPSAPSQFYRDASGIYAVVPMTSRFKAKDGTFQLEGNLIAVSTDNGANWTFADATGKDQTELKKIFPNLDKLNLPAEKPPTKVSD